ncbi:MAG TPA: hypothetical protein VFU08_06075 [Candidatus Udaeobacter sp.]|nr:hypothetical protein [Candidatus Udaeobacter sp.]
MARFPRGLPGRSLRMDKPWPSISIFRSLMSICRIWSCAKLISWPGRWSLGVSARAVLHHVADAEKAIANLVASLRPGGAILLIEPDFLPVTIAEPQEVHMFWNNWLAWSRERGIDYQIGRTLAPRLAVLGLERIAGTAETAIYNGTSMWADYWAETVKELGQDLMSSGKLTTH